MTDAESLKEIEKFADQLHGDQTRKYTPERYIVHPVRVMKILQSYTDDICMLAAALLHDVLEDTPVSKEELRDFLNTLMHEPQVTRTILLVIELTDVYVKKDFPELNRSQRKSRELERIKYTSSDAQTIKYADIIDNCNEIVKHDRQFAGVFLKECKKVLEVATSGNQDLYNKAKILIEEKLRELNYNHKT